MPTLICSSFNSQQRRCRLKPVEEVHSLLGFGRGGEDGATVVVENLQPPANISGMVRARLDCEAQPGGEECGAEFRDQLFECVGLAAEAVLEVAIETVF